MHGYCLVSKSLCKTTSTVTSVGAITSKLVISYNFKNNINFCESVCIKLKTVDDMCVWCEHFWLIQPQISIDPMYSSCRRRVHKLGNNHGPYVAAFMKPR